MHPGSICSRVWRQRESFAQIWSTVAVQTKGRGLSFQASRKAAMARLRSGVLGKLRRRIALVLKWANQRSTMFSQLELVGMKCATKRGWRSNHALTFGCL